MRRIKAAAAGPRQDSGHGSRHMMAWQARIRELTARLKMNPIWETTSRSSSGEAAVIDHWIMAMQKATGSKCTGLHLQDDNAMKMSWHFMADWESIDQGEAVSVCMTGGP